MLQRICIYAKNLFFLTSSFLLAFSCHRKSHELFFVLNQFVQISHLISFYHSHTIGSEFNIVRKDKHTNSDYSTEYMVFLEVVISAYNHTNVKSSSS